MSRPQPPKPAKLVIGLFTKHKALFEPVVTNLSERFGEIDTISRWFSFSYTDYYEKEMGAPLFRRMISFKRLIPQEALAAIKLSTNEIEAVYGQDGKRQINIDPGYLLLERFVLATGKNYTHRIFIGSGIYADLTLIYSKGDFRTLPWTYPDYASQDIMGFLTNVRKKYNIDLKNEGELKVESGEIVGHEVY